MKTPKKWGDGDPDRKSFDKLMVEASNSDGVKRFEKFRDAEEFYLNKGSAIPIVRPSLKLLARNDVCGITLAQSADFSISLAIMVPRITLEHLPTRMG